MEHLNLKNFTILLFLCLGIIRFGGEVQAAQKDIFSNSGLNLPRFVSLAEEKTNVRAGPGKKYPVKWVLNRKALPVEIILEFDHWRKIKDPDGQEGWVFHSLLSGERRAVVSGKFTVPVYESYPNLNSKKSRISIYLEPSVIVSLNVCDGEWCEVSTSGLSGWIEKKLIWGVYETENID